MSGTTAVSILVWNERTKFLANVLDRASTAFGVGSIFPLINLWRTSISSTDTPSIVLFFVASAAGFMFVAAMLHLAGRRVLGNLR